MKAKFYQICNRIASSKLSLSQASSKLSQSTDSSRNSIDISDGQYKKCATKWILSYNRKIAKDTNYIALSYLSKLPAKSITINQNNWQKIAVTLLLLASKNNQIYPPSISNLLSKCKGNFTKEDIIDMESYILHAFDFDMTVESTVYTHMIRILGNEHANKLEDCEKLFKTVSAHQEIYKHGEQTLVYALVYLIKSQCLRQIKIKDNQKIKTLATEIYRTYSQVKNTYGKKENKTY